MPIGLVASDWGGQRVEAFSSPDAINDKTCGGTVKPGSLQRDPPPAPNPADTSLWYGMICPLLRMRFAGATWYQGESNAGDPASYACRFPAMITDWRKKMNLTLPFYFVEVGTLNWGSFIRLMASIKPLRPSAHNPVPLSPSCLYVAGCLHLFQLCIYS